MTNSSATGTNTQARFLHGSTFRHVVIMTLTGALGLMTLFVVDLADLYFLSRLGNTDLTAAIGFAGTLDFANLSLSIGSGIAAAALVARYLGAGNPQRAREFATSTMLVSFAFSAAYTILIAIFIGPILSLLGATGEAARLAKLFIWTLSPGFIFLGGALACSFSLRGLGDAKRAMYITMVTATVTIILDPIFIFYFGWGIQGAAAANAISCIAAFGVGYYALRHVHDFLPPASWSGLKRDLPEILSIALPAILTQLATPFAAAYMNYTFAPFGNEIVAAGTVVNRVVPVAFGIIFSLSGSVGPIIGQNFGARNFTRVNRTLRDGIAFAFLYALVTSFILFLFRHEMASAFSVTGRAAELVVFFATYIAASWAFVGAQFVAMAAFNNLGKPGYSTLVNWGKATIGTIPFAIAGAAIAGAEGIMVGIALGGIVFGVVSVFMAWSLVKKLSASSPSGA
ncbi:MATE family efflux transporter [Aestuariivirga litoralis]|uniref:MATE family efflux transporter n=1 Tax=Aestuariivirga litoralis TaxID=2650924 RepID=UPI0018C663BC|nr:MATE family efflux transporter [Aestuariivirga litoralis]MBG1233428.1 MATE family efflux transporter [Aestuariivirga litoralis]